MDRLRTYLKYALISTAFISFGFHANGQNQGDSLTLGKIISVVIQNHPSVSEALETVKSAEAGIGLAKAGYYPVVDASASYSRIGPVQEITIPGNGTFDLFPPDTYSANLNYFQTVYDFGKTSKNIDLAKEAKNINVQSLEQVKQKLAYTVTLIYYSVFYLQQAIEINKQELNTLKEHLDFVEKKLETGSVTKYEVLSTKVKISNVESNGIDLQTNLKNQVTELNSLMAQNENTSFTVREELDVKLPVMTEDSLLSFAFEHRDEVKIAKEKTTLAELKYKNVDAQNNPTVNVQLSGGMKNGYFPNQSAVKANFSAGLGVKIPIFDGTRSKFNLSQAKSAVSISESETELAKISVAKEVIQNEENLNASLKKIEHSNLQLSQSQEAFLLAQRSFKAGVITNLDLLDAETAISESSLLLLKSKIEYVTNVFRLKASIGERLY